MKILVADDDKENLELISLYLARMGHDVIAVNSGQKALKHFAAEHPDLIILDVLMPVMDGFECATEIRAIGGEDWIPIIFLSAVVDDSSVAKGINAGGDDYLTKPISPILLEAKIKAMQRISTMRNKLFDTTKKLSILSITDSLTGVYNRFELDRIIKQKIQIANNQKLLLALILLDLDNFKSINDTLGHYVGDLLLKEVSKRISACLRKTDFLARMGGDEFAIILQIDKINDVDVIASKISSILSTSYNLEGHSLFVTASFGIACYPFAGTDEKILMQNADIAMYQAKAIGKNNFQYYSKEMIEKNKHHSKIEAMLRNAFKTKELSIIYRPIFNLINERIIGIEAHLQWIHPDMGVILPEVFIPIAEKSNLINQIGEWFFQTVCRQVKKWQKTGVTKLNYWIKVSSRQLLKSDLPQVIQKIITKENLATQQFSIVINETILMNYLSFTEKILYEIHNAGIKVAINDFGVGYSSLVHLKQFPISSLKIHKSFIQDIFSDDNDAIILSALITLGNKLGLKTIAEGIETKEQLRFLIENNCIFGQGDYLCASLSTKEMTSFLIHHFNV